MENGNIISEEKTKSENDYKIKPTKNIVFFREKSTQKDLIAKKTKKNLLKTTNGKAFMKENKMLNLLKLSQSYYNKKGNMKMYPIKISSKNENESRKENELFKKISGLKYNLNIKHSNFGFMPKIPTKIIKLKKRNSHDININYHILSNKSSNADNFSNINFSRYLESKSPNVSMNNESIILSKNNSISRINFFSYENKIKYLFGKIKRGEIKTIENYSNKNNIKYKFKLNNSLLKKNLIRDKSKLNRILYNLEDKNNLSFYSNKKNSFELDKYSIKNDSSSISIYQNIIINNKIKKNLNYKLSPLKIPERKEKYRSILNISQDNEEKYKIFPN